MMAMSSEDFYPPLEGEGRRRRRRGGVIVTERKPIDRFRKAAARRMRTNATDAEARLWKHLRHHPMIGSHFRRQVVIGPYIADFACMAARLIVEVDGSQHGRRLDAARDDMRTKWFKSEGYRVIRFWNNDIFMNTDGVLSEIHAALTGIADGDAIQLKRERRRKADHPTPARDARRPFPSRGG
jgi:very-short-patch-repair endonuclease